MNSMRKCRVLSLLPVLAVLFAVPGSLTAQSTSYSGIYLGQTADGLGGFALFVNASQNALLIGGYRYNDDDGDALYGSCTVNASGGGSSDISGINTSFTISSNGSVNLLGSADDGSYSFQMAGSRDSSGPFLSVSGSYSGEISGQTIQAIVTPDGWIYQSSPNHGGGARVQVTAYGQAATESSLGHAVNTATLSQSAQIDLSGVLTLNRVDSLPMLGAAGLTNGLFVFSATGLTIGGTNVLQTCSQLNPTNWVSIATNISSASTASFTNAVGGGTHFFRLLQLP